MRDNDLATLRSRAADKRSVNEPGPKGVTPLMQAAAFGSLDAMKILLDGGADVNAKDSFGATALIWAAGDAVKTRLLIKHGADVNAKTVRGRTAIMVAASHDGSVETVRLLLNKDAEAGAADDAGDTALLAAAIADDAETVALLLNAGADPNRSNNNGYTPLIRAAGNGNLAMVRLLLDKGADVNAANVAEGKVRFGDIALKGLTPLMFAAPHSGVEVVKALLDAGAEVNARDSRDMTSLMFAAASESRNTKVVKLLLSRGADPNAKSNTGETALDWAKKFGDKGVTGALERVGAKEGSPWAGIPERRGLPASDVRAALERSVSLLQSSGAEFFRQSACVGCHHQPMVQMTTAAARSAGIAVDASIEKELAKSLEANWAMFREGLLERMDGPASPDFQVFSAFGMAAGGKPSADVTDALAVNVAAKQQRDGSWRFRGISRAPMSESQISRTAMSLRTLQLFGVPGRRDDFATRVERARLWLEKSRPRTTDDHVWRLLGLYWSQASQGEVQSAAKDLIKLQRADGGWGQNPNLASDAYGAGTALWALRMARILSPSDEEYRRGVEFLLRTQYADGSWYVRSRSPKFQPYFESGFPFGHDQWVSTTATAWAAMALAPAVGLPGLSD